MQDTNPGIVAARQQISLIQHLLSPLLLHIIHLLSKMRQEKEAKSIQIGTEETKLPLFSKNLILYIEIKKEKLKRKKRPELINT